MNSIKPLSGVKVVDLSTFIAGPCCCRYLADLGAEVVKVEPPAGDPLRYVAPGEGRPFGDNEDTTFTLENAGKKCVTINTKDPAGREILERLIAKADVLVTNWRQPALKRSNLDYETLKEKYPKLVFGYVSGYGEKGPDKDLPGFDFTAYFARGGVLGTMYDKDSIPLIPIAGFGDHQVGMNLASGIIAALLQAEKTGKGNQVISSLYHAAVWDLAVLLQASQYGHPSSQYPIQKKQIANPLQSTYKTKDGIWVQIAMPAYDRFFQAFVKDVLGREDLANEPKFFPQKNLAPNVEELYAIIVSMLGDMPLATLEERMKACDMPYSVCQTWDMIMKDEQAWANDMLAKVKFPGGDERILVRPPVLFTESELPSYERGAFLGENTLEVLADLGYDKATIADMVEKEIAFDIKRIG